MTLAVVWFRRDLRLADNPALAAAAEADEIVPVFCFEQGLHSGRHRSPNRNAYLLAALRELDDGLRGVGSRLHYVTGDPVEEIPKLASECGTDAVHVNRDHTAHARSRDGRVEAALVDDDVALVGHGGITCAEIARIETGSGDPFRVFTPFHKAWAKAPRRELADKPRRLSTPSGIGVGRPPTERNLGVHARAKRIADEAGPGEKAARKLMFAAVENCDDYERVRDLPGEDATTHLSAPLHFGTISPREVEELLIERGTEGAAAVRRQLAWRDFWLSVIRAFPENRTTEHDERFRGMKWREDPESLQAWKQGETGVPWIDAGMRQLRDQGWMHNRLRMAVASYLTKNLLIDWREGESHFMENLIDGDESQNNGNWQWAASTGADPQPYFRIFNPVLQQEKFGADGVYVRRWVPELTELPDRYLAAPWDAPKEVQEEANCVIGTDYPAPLVDLKESRAEAISRFEEQRG